MIFHTQLFYSPVFEALRRGQENAESAMQAGAGAKPHPGQARVPMSLDGKATRLPSLQHEGVSQGNNAADHRVLRHAIQPGQPLQEESPVQDRRARRHFSGHHRQDQMSRQAIRQVIHAVSLQFTLPY